MKKFFNFDLHISVIEDLKCIFKDLGHQIDSRCISGHTFVFGRPAIPMEIVNQYNWMQLNPSMCNDFYERYKDELRSYDGFVVTYPPAFSLLYEKFDKPIILQVPIRYETPFTMKPDYWKWLNEFLKKGIDDKRIILVANSIYDKKYCEYFLERECKYIFNICDYGNTYPKWTGTLDKFLLFNDSNIKFVSPIIQDRHQLKVPYTWKQIEEYKAIIHIPYNSSTMSTYEQYSANTPLIFPSKDFLVELMMGNTNVLCGLTWNQYFNAPPTAGNNPNNYKDATVLKEWLSYAEYYNKESMPGIIYFNSINHLKQLLTSPVDYNKISTNMATYNILRKEKVMNAWKEIIEKL